MKTSKQLSPSTLQRTILILYEPLTESQIAILNETLDYELSIISYAGGSSMIDVEINTTKFLDVINLNFVKKIEMMGVTRVH